MHVVLTADGIGTSIMGEEADAFSQKLKQVEDDCTDEQVVLDFSGIECINSLAMGCLYSTCQKLSEQRRSLRIIHPCESVKRLLKMVNLGGLVIEE